MIEVYSIHCICIQQKLSQIPYSPGWSYLNMCPTSYWKPVHIATYRGEWIGLGMEWAGFKNGISYEVTVGSTEVRFPCDFGFPQAMKNKKLSSQWSRERKWCTHSSLRICPQVSRRERKRDWQFSDGEPGHSVVLDRAAAMAEGRQSATIKIQQSWAWKKCCESLLKENAYPSHWRRWKQHINRCRSVAFWLLKPGQCGKGGNEMK